VGSPEGMVRAVLIIEDEDRIRRIVSITLRREGLEVTEAGSGEEGLARLAERPYDIVLLDLVLPGRDGFEVCREIRRTSTTPVIMVTARADSQDVVAGLEAGADDYVTKPFVTEELSARIRALARLTSTSPPWWCTAAPILRSPGDEVRDLLSALPDAELVTLPGSGHVLPLTHGPRSPNR
jgi:DNA-binding response OmpR family regulator